MVQVKQSGGGGVGLLLIVIVVLCVVFLNNNRNYDAIKSIDETIIENGKNVEVGSTPTQSVEKSETITQSASQKPIVTQRHRNINPINKFGQYDKVYKLLVECFRAKQQHHLSINDDKEFAKLRNIQKIYLLFYHWEHKLPIKLNEKYYVNDVSVNLWSGSVQSKNCKDHVKLLKLIQDSMPIHVTKMLHLYGYTNPKTLTDLYFTRVHNILVKICLHFWQVVSSILAHKDCCKTDNWLNHCIVNICEMTNFAIHYIVTVNTDVIYDYAHPSLLLVRICLWRISDVLGFTVPREMGLDYISRWMDEYKNNNDVAHILPHVGSVLLTDALKYFNAFKPSCCQQGNRPLRRIFITHNGHIAISQVKNHYNHADKNERHSSNNDDGVVEQPNVIVATPSSIGSYWSSSVSETSGHNKQKRLQQFTDLDRVAWYIPLSGREFILLNWMKMPLMHIRQDGIHSYFSRQGQIKTTYDNSAIKQTASNICYLYNSHIDRKVGFEVVLCNQVFNGNFDTERIATSLILDSMLVLPSTNKNGSEKHQIVYTLGFERYFDFFTTNSTSNKYGSANNNDDILLSLLFVYINTRREFKRQKIEISKEVQENLVSIINHAASKQKQNNNTRNIHNSIHMLCDHLKIENSEVFYRLQNFAHMLLCRLLKLTASNISDAIALIGKYDKKMAREIKLCERVVGTFAMQPQIEYSALSNWILSRWLRNYQEHSESQEPSMKLAIQYFDKRHKYTEDENLDEIASNINSASMLNQQDSSREREKSSEIYRKIREEIIINRDPCVVWNAIMLMNYPISNDGQDYIQIVEMRPDRRSYGGVRLTQANLDSKAQFVDFNVQFLGPSLWKSIEIINAHSEILLRFDIKFTGQISAARIQIDKNGDIQLLLGYSVNPIFDHEKSSIHIQLRPNHTTASVLKQHQDGQTIDLQECKYKLKELAISTETTKHSPVILNGTAISRFISTIEDNARFTTEVPSTSISIIEN